MEISIDRRAEVPGAKDLKFTVSVRSIDNHTHGELTRGDQAEIRAVLARAANGIEASLRNSAREDSEMTVFATS